MTVEPCMCGAEDCPYCHPDRFIGISDSERLIDEAIYKEMENNENDNAYV